VATTVARLEAILGADTKDFDRGMSQADSKMGKTAKGISTGAKVAGAALVGLGAVAVAGMKSSFDAASSLGESMNAVNVVFGKSGKLITDFGENAARKTGLSMRELNEAVTPIGAGLINAGFSADQAAKSSIALTERAADMASVFNTDVGTALEALQAGLRGESDPLEKFGVGLSAAAVNAQALEMGLAKTEKELTANDKAQARLGLIMEQTNRLQGDFANTSDGAANAQRIMNAEIENAQSKIGQALLPVMAKLFSSVSTLIPKVLEWGSAFADKVGPVIQRVGELIQEYGPPVIQALITATQAIVRETQQAWPKIQQIIEAVVDWFNQNLRPTIASIAGNIQEHWGTISKVTERVWNALITVIKPALETIRSVINVVLAVIRGDWQTAWDNLKKIPGQVLDTLVAVVKGFGPLFLDAAKAIGKAMIDGIVAGVKAAPGLVKDAIVGVVENAYEGAKDWLGIESPSKRMMAIGRSITDGLSVGVLEQKLKLANALMEVLDAAVDKARDRASRVGGNLTSMLSNAFSAKQSGVRTKSEALIDEINAKRKMQDLNNALITAERDLTAAMASTAEDREEKILEAGRRLEDARVALLMDGLEKQAAIERKELDGRLAVEQMNFNTRLSNLQTYLASGEATASGATSRIQEFMATFGISMGEIGELLGTSYAQGIRNMIPAAVRAATELTEAVAAALAGQQVVTKIEKALTVAEKAEAALGRTSAALNKKYGLGGPAGDVPAGRVVPGPGGGSTIDTLASFARQLGFNPSQGQMTGGTHVKGSLHYQGKAIDMSGSASAMKEAFYSSIATFGSRINELFYDPIGWHINDGKKIGGALGGHNDHVHLGLFDRGGWLPPKSKTLAINNTSKWEPVGPPGRGFGGNVYVTVHGWVGNERSLARQIRDALGELDSASTGGRVLNSAPTLT
jgi:phage-related protein